MNILLVEDELGIREGLAALLRTRGHVVHAAESVARGTRLAADHAFDLVVTDWRLGDGLGLEVIEHCGCAAIVMSGYPEEVAAATGDATVLEKPVPN